MTPSRSNYIQQMHRNLPSIDPNNDYSWFDAHELIQYLNLDDECIETLFDLCDNDVVTMARIMVLAHHDYSSYSSNELHLTIANQDTVNNGHVNKNFEAFIEALRKDSEEFMSEWSEGSEQHKNSSSSADKGRTPKLSK